VRRALALILALAPLSAGAVAKGLPVPVVVISIDALRPDFVLEADRHGLKVPNLRRLLAEGAHATGVSGVLPTATYPSHATLVTGVSPARHGILSNGPFDPLARNASGWYWYAEDFRVPTLWDAAADAGLATAAVEWPVTAGARLTHNIPQFWRTSDADAPDDLKLRRLLSTPGLLREAEAAVGPFPAGGAFTVAEDERRAEFNIFLLERKRPALHLCYFAGLDEESHETAPDSPEAMAVLERIDALVGKVRAAAERSGGGQAIVAVVSDHAQVATEREVSIDEAFRAAGLILLDAKGRPTAWRARAWGGGGSAAIVIKDGADAEARQKVEVILRGLVSGERPPLESVMRPEEAPEARAFPGIAFIAAAALDTRIVSRMEGTVQQPGLRKGSHGHLPSHRELDAAFVIAGPGIPRGRNLGRIDMRDVAPTIAARLGLSLPSAEGKDVLAAGGR
jgi:predicted AlkP superfamily pyrophosphatase or phosphodiesterase